jgi:hypothetical protein
MDTGRASPPRKFRWAATKRLGTFGESSFLSSPVRPYHSHYLHVSAVVKIRSAFHRQTPYSVKPPLHDVFTKAKARFDDSPYETILDMLNAFALTKLRASAQSDDKQKKNQE